MNKLGKYSRRFFRSFFTKLSPGDLEFLRSHLSKQEQILFYRLSAMDQRHSLNTAYSAEQAAERGQKVNLKVLVKIALMHDVGKVTWLPPLRCRVWAVLFNMALPFLAKFLAKRGKSKKAGKLSRALYIMKEHGHLGAELLKELDWGEAPLYIIAHHHDAPQAKDPLELAILRQADEEN